MGPEVRDFSPGGCHRLLATKPVQFRNQQSRTALSGDHGSICDSSPVAFLVIREGLGYCLRLRARGTQRLTAISETRSRTRVSRGPDGHRWRRFPALERTRSETLKLFVVSDDWRRSTPR